MVSSSILYGLPLGINYQLQHRCVLLLQASGISIAHNQSGKSDIGKCICIFHCKSIMEKKQKTKKKNIHFIYWYATLYEIIQWYISITKIPRRITTLLHDNR